MIWRSLLVGDSVTIPLKLSHINVIKVEESGRNLLVYVETTESGTCCSCCGKHICKKQGKDKEIKLRHLSMLDYKTYIIFQPNRYICDDCKGHPTTTAMPEWHKPNSSQTVYYEKRILIELVNSTVVDVSTKENITEDKVVGTLNRYIEPEIDWSTLESLGVIGIDEIAIKKGYKDYITIITSRVGGDSKLLAVLKGRKKSVIKAFLKSIPNRLKKTVTALCVDMYEGYIAAAKSVFKNTMLIVVDRFHVAKLYRGALDKYRQKVLKELKQMLSVKEYEKVIGATRILRKANECLTKQEKQIVNELFSYAPNLMEAYRLAIHLTHLFNSDTSKEQALEKIQGWIAEVRYSKLPCFDKFIKTLRRYKNEIANYFIDRNSSGFIEGLNNKIKVLKRRCYGIFNAKHLFQRLYLDISGYSLLLGKSAC